MPDYFCKSDVQSAGGADFPLPGNLKICFLPHFFPYQTEAGASAGRPRSCCNWRPAQTWDGGEKILPGGSDRPDHDRCKADDTDH